jgi:hypothetical protein
MRVKPVLALAAIALLMAACGDQTSGGRTGGDPAGLGPAADGAGGGDVPITARAVAAVALVHLPEDTSSRQGAYLRYEDAPGTMGAELRYRASPGEDGDLVSVRVSPEVVAPRPPSWLAAAPCSTAGYRCLSDQGETGAHVLLWRPGPDGEVWALGLRDGEAVGIRFSGWRVPEDPAAVERQVDFDHVRRLLDDDVRFGQVSTRDMTGIRF